MNTREMTDKLQDVRRQASDKLRDVSRRATETARNVGSAADNYVRENTWATIGLAVALGCIIGLLLANRSED